MARETEWMLRSSHIRKACRSFWLLLAILAVVTYSSARAQGLELFQPLDSQQHADLTPSQSANLAKIQHRPTTSSITLMTVNLAALNSAWLSLALTTDKRIQVNQSRVETVLPNTKIWRGTLPNVPGQATLVVEDGKITGTVVHNSDLYRIESVGNGVHAVIKVDQSKFPADHPPSFLEKERRAPIPRPDEGKSNALPFNSRVVSVDVLVAFTPAAGGAVPNIKSTIQLAVEEANTSYLNSGVNLHLNLVDTVQVNYSEDGKTFDTILSDFVANKSVKERRDNASADLVAMIINKADYCGLANAIQATADTAYAIVYFDCATGYYSFAHELGHLFGARHDAASDPTNTPFAYGHGYRYESGATSWRTIMAYNCSNGCRRIQYWSNPDIKYEGVPTGTADVSNNARVLNEQADVVAAFRTSPGKDAKHKLD